MKILKVIVDEMPKSASRCGFAKGGFDIVVQQHGVTCRFADEPVWVTTRQLVTTRCPDCPLALADALIDKHDKAFKELAKGAE